MLLSYADRDVRERPLPAGFDVIIDSGAYTAHTKGIKIDRDEYTAFLAERVGQFRFAVALDVIGDPEATTANYQAMRIDLLGTSVPLMPVWHIKSDPAILERLCKHSPLVAVGGMVGLHASALIRLAFPAHQIAAGHGVKLHGLGVTSTRALTLPWTSVDSASWTIARRYPLLYLTRPCGTIRRLERGLPIDPADAALVRAYGLDPDHVTDKTATLGEPGKAVVHDMRVAMARTYMEQERHGHHPKVFLATFGYDRELNLIAHAHAAGSPYLAPQPQPQPEGTP
ncbi:DpdA-like tRNA-guanine transglycosylase [Mycobacterium phage Funsized]|nr:DpdA-like tRNA-guanine transglycosylase [Mycobacterium phage Funsized]